MNDFIFLFGTVILLFGAVIFLKPDRAVRIFRNNSDPQSTHVLAIVTRIIFGLALLIYAAESKYPIVLQYLGWFSILLATTFILMGHTRFKNLISRVLGVASPCIRAAGGTAVFLGGFLIYAIT